MCVCVCVWGGGGGDAVIILDVTEVIYISQIKYSPSFLHTKTTSPSHFPRSCCRNILPLFPPGPGQYDSSSPLGKGKQGLLCCRDQRFKPTKKTALGPGTYNVCYMQTQAELMFSIVHMCLANCVHNTRFILMYYTCPVRE